MSNADYSAVVNDSGDSEPTTCPGNDEGEHLFRFDYDAPSPCRYCGVPYEHALSGLSDRERDALEPA